MDRMGQQTATAETPVTPATEAEKAELAGYLKQLAQIGRVKDPNGLVHALLWAGHRARAQRLVDEQAEGKCGDVWLLRPKDGEVRALVRVLIDYGVLPESCLPLVPLTTTATSTLSAAE